jgi:hypothetical protein
MFAPYRRLVLDPILRVLGTSPAEVASAAGHVGNTSLEIGPMAFSAGILVLKRRSLVPRRHPVGTVLSRAFVECGLCIRGRSPAPGEGQQPDEQNQACNVQVLYHL